MKERAALNLAEFLALAQHEVQKTIEYLAQPQVREQSPEAPSQIFAQVGTIRMTVPVRFDVRTEGCPCCGGGEVELRPHEGSQERDPREILRPGMPYPPGGRLEMKYHLNVSTVGGCASEGGCSPTGKLEIEFITCLKQ